MIGVLDYGMGNLRSVTKAFEYVGVPVSIVKRIELGIERIVIPGVGAFGAAMERLAPLRDDILAFARSGQPLLGICLGQQLLFESSQEIGEHQGLGLLPGKVCYLPKLPGLKVPHVGWNQTVFRSHEGIAAGLGSNDLFYFVHSLYTACADPADVLATTVHGVEFPSAVQRGNVWGTQFHPEKSGQSGLRLLRNFAAC